jgi:hypothetical protein
MKERQFSGGDMAYNASYRPMACVYRISAFEDGREAWGVKREAGEAAAKEAHS